MNNQYKQLLTIIPMLMIFSTSLMGQVDIKAGAGLTFGSEDIADLGVQLKGVADFNAEWSGAANVTFWFTDLDNSSFTTINLDGHYNFYPNEDIKVYPLAGLNIGISSFDNPAGEDSSDSEIGINLGGGVEYPFSEQITGFGELKYTINDAADQIVISAGAMYEFN